MRVTLGCAVELGDLLNEAKKMVPHGEFQTWCEANTNYSARRCQEFIKLSKSAELRAFDPASAVHVAVKALSGISTREPAEPQPWTIDDGINKTREAVARLLKRWPPEHIVTFANQLESLASEVRTKGKLPL
ncbi:MAG: DUF3102 domain-containing protein [Planctomycetes bacterium]|nr:DUF3102 domain-containing protein [Planctomycetota bacterium]